MFRGPILAWSSLSRTAASSASGVGGGAARPCPWLDSAFLWLDLRRPRGRCAAAEADHPAQHQPQPVAPIQKRRFRFCFVVVVDSHDQPAISSTPQVSPTPAVPAYPTEQTPETGTFPPRLARGNWTSWRARRLAAWPTPSSSCSDRIAGCLTVPKNLHADARIARISWTSLIAPSPARRTRGCMNPVCVAPGQGWC